MIFSLRQQVDLQAVSLHTSKLVTLPCSPQATPTWRSYMPVAWYCTAARARAQQCGIPPAPVRRGGITSASASLLIRAACRSDARQNSPHNREGVLQCVAMTPIISTIFLCEKSMQELQPPAASTAPSFGGLPTFSGVRVPVPHRSLRNRASGEFLLSVRAQLCPADPWHIGFEI
jgi:hypothetical protein